MGMPGVALRTEARIVDDATPSKLAEVTAVESRIRVKLARPGIIHTSDYRTVSAVRHVRRIRLGHDTRLVSTERFARPGQNLDTNTNVNTKDRDSAVDRAGAGPSGSSEV